MRETEAPAPGETSEAWPPAVGFWKAFRFWLKLGCMNFGGPTGQIAIMHEELVERRRWISNERFLHALNYCMLLPGPEAQQLAIYVGWLLHRTAGGLAAGILFVLPAALLMLGLSWLYAVHGNVAWIAAIFYGLRAAVIAIVAAAVLRIGRKALKNSLLVAIAAAAFVAIFFFKVPFPLIILAAGLAGFAGDKLVPDKLAPALAASDEPELATVLRDDLPPPAHARPSFACAVRVCAVGLLAWWGPLVAVALWRGAGDTLTKEAVFFSKAAMVTFGGAYAVLAYIAQAAVQRYGWLEPHQMLDGLGLAETTPGPLILVTQFVGFLGAYHHPGNLPPVSAGILGAAVTVWATFAPCFLWIFLGAPFIERLRGNRLLNAALSGITAAVVGVILNLSVWLSLHTLFREVRDVKVLAVTLPVPTLATIDLFSLALAAAAFALMWRLRWRIEWVVAAAALTGLVFRTIHPFQ